MSTFRWQVVAVSLLRLIVLTAVLASACATVPKPDASQEDAVKAALPRPGKSMVFIMRPSLIGAFGTWSIQVDFEDIGELDSGSFYAIELPPGTHFFGGNTNPIGAPRTATKMHMELTAGQHIFLRLSLGNPWRAMRRYPELYLDNLEREEGLRELSGKSLIRVVDFCAQFPPRCENRR